MYALIYTRVSTEEQAQDGRVSLQTQRSLCERAIEQGGYKLAPNGIYEDPGRSATNMNRPGLQDMLIRIQEDKTIKAVFIQDTDRLARNVGDHLTIKAVLHKHEVKLVSVSQSIEDTPEGNFMDLIIAGVNQLQSQITGRKTSKSMDERFRSGWWPTRAPIGYLNAGTPDNPDKRIIILDPIKAPLIKELFEKYSTGAQSIFDLRDKLFKKGLTPLAGDKKPALAVMFRTIENPFYFGEMNWKGEKRIGNHIPVISKELFEKCQSVKARRNHFAIRERKYNFLLNGYLYSATDSSRYFGEYQQIKDLGYYRCHAKDGVIKSKIDKPVKAEKIEEYVEDAFCGIQFSDKFIKRLTIRVKEIYESKKLLTKQQKNSLEIKKTTLTGRLETAEEKLLAGVLSNEDFTRIKIRIREQIDGIDQEITNVERTRNIKVDVIQDVLALIRNVGEAYKKAPTDLKRVYLSLFWERFELADRLIANAKPTKIIRALVDTGALCINKRQKPIPIEGMFAYSNESYRQNIGISNLRGGYRESNPSRKFHKLQC